MANDNPDREEDEGPVRVNGNVAFSYTMSPGSSTAENLVVNSGLETGSESPWTGTGWQAGTITRGRRGK